MQVYDIIMLAVLLAAIGFGAWKGLSWQLASLSAIFVSYFVALELKDSVARSLGVTQQWEVIVVMLVLYLITSLLIWVIFGYIRKVIDKVKLQDFDRHAGAVLGAVKGVVLCLIITLFAVSLLGDSQKHSVCCSYSGYFMAKLIDKIDVAMPAEVKQTIGPYLDKLDQELTHEHPSEHHAEHGSTHDDESELNAARTAKRILDFGKEVLDDGEGPDTKTPEDSELDPARTAKKILDIGNEILNNR